MHGVRTPAVDPGCEPIYHQYTVRAERRDALAGHLRARGIGCAVYYPVGLHLQPCFGALGYRPGSLPETERAAAENLALPLWAGIDVVQQAQVVSAVRAAVGVVV